MNKHNLLDSRLSYWAGIKTVQPWITEAETGAAISYTDLNKNVRALRAYLGEEPRIILLAMNGGIVNATIWLSSLSGGHLLIPISPASTKYELEELIEKHHPDLFFSEDVPATISSSVKIIDKARIETIIESYSLEVNTTNVDASRDGRVYFSTSGSTGKPKGIILNTSRILVTADNIIASHKLTSTDRSLTPLPFHHVNAPVVSLVTSILSGGELVIASKYSTSNFWLWLQRYNPTWVSLVPTMITMLLSTEPKMHSSTSLRFIRSASAPLPKSTLESFETKFHIPIIETYGISEAGSTIASNPIPPAIHKAGSVGFPIGLELLICSDTSHEQLSKNTVGEVCIKGENVIDYYEEDRSPESFSNGWFKTGDLGYIDEDGYLFLTGRIKDIIIKGGENIFPREIENVFHAHHLVNEAVVVGSPDPIMGEKIIAFIELSTSDMLVPPTELMLYAKDHLSKQKNPDEVRIVSDMPRTHTNKIDRNRLRQMASARTGNVS